MFLINTVQCQPPGTLKIGKDNFYFDRTEVTNIGWQEFLYYQKNKYGEIVVPTRPISIIKYSNLNSN